MANFLIGVVFFLVAIMVLINISKSDDKKEEERMNEKEYGIKKPFLNGMLMNSVYEFRVDHAKNKEKEKKNKEEEKEEDGDDV